MAIPLKEAHALVAQAVKQFKALSQLEVELFSLAEFEAQKKALEKEIPLFKAEADKAKAVVAAEKAEAKRVIDFVKAESAAVCAKDAKAAADQVAIAQVQVLTAKNELAAVEKRQADAIRQHDAALKVLETELSKKRQERDRLVSELATLKGRLAPLVA